MATYMKGNNKNCRIKILYNDRIALPLSAAERVKARKMDIQWIPYDGDVRPTVQDGYITYNEPGSQIERELAWDQLVLSPKRHPGAEQLKVAQILGLDVHGDDFLERNPQMVRPEQVGVEEKFLAGSARKPCDLRETLRQGRRAAQKTAEIIKKSRTGELFAPRIVCTVDQSKCIGCGLCKEICDCGGIAPVDGPGGNIPRIVDPMRCTGGGTCAAACPYHALSLQNNTTSQREARVAAIASRLADNEVMGFGCRWGGGAAADNAGVRSIQYSERFYLLPIDCIGQLDPIVMGKAFLEGANGLLLLGCPPEECHHSYGLDHTWSRVLLVKKLLNLIGLERDRIALAHTDLNKPEQLARTVDRFVSMMDSIGPIDRTDEMKRKIRDLYDTLSNSRVRWVLGANLRRPWETTYPADQRNALAFDETFSDVIKEEYLRTRVLNYLRKEAKVLHLNDIVSSIGEEKQRVLHCLKDLSDEGMISRIYKDRVPYYSLQ
jgi:coenzyme F420-reducing hydrogenase delta subunit/ferredoxin